MKAILMGYPRSKEYVPFSSYLQNKYLHSEIEVIYSNYGDAPQLYGNHLYYKLRRQHISTKKRWSRKLISVIADVIDEDFLILGLDDYFLSRPMNYDAYGKLLNHLSQNKQCAGAKLGLWVSYDRRNILTLENSIYKVREDAPWPVTTQFTVWRKSFILKYLNECKSPWDFEIKGKSFLNENGFYMIGSTSPALCYPESSAISSRHVGKVSVFANREEDIEFGLKNGMLKKSKLVLGQWDGYAPPYESGIDSQKLALKFCPAKEYSYQEHLLEACLNSEKGWNA